MEFLIVDETKKRHEYIKEKIKQMGGKLAEEVHQNLAAIIWNADEVNKMGSAMQVALNSLAFKLCRKNSSTKSKTMIQFRCL